MTRRPPQSTRTDTPLPSPTLFRSDDTGAAGTEDIVVRIFDAQGNVVGGFDIDESGFWNLGDDTTDPIAVHVVYEGDRSVDTFAANVTQEDLARSEEHTSELQSLMRISYAVFCLKKKTNTTKT